MLKQLRELRRLLAQNPELGDGVLGILDKIIKDAEEREVMSYEERADILIRENI